MHEEKTMSPVIQGTANTFYEIQEGDEGKTLRVFATDNGKEDGRVTFEYQMAHPQFTALCEKLHNAGFCLKPILKVEPTIESGPRVFKSAASSEGAPKKTRKPKAQGI